MFITYKLDQWWGGASNELISGWEGVQGKWASSTAAQDRTGDTLP